MLRTLTKGFILIFALVVGVTLLVYFSLVENSIIATLSILFVFILLAVVTINSLFKSLLRHFANKSLCYFNPEVVIKTKDN